MSRNSVSPPVFPYPWASDWGEDQYGLWMAFTYKNVRYGFRWIMPGRFTMGSSTNEKGRYDDEDQHTVILTEGFWLGETTVTQELWKVFMGTNPSYFSGKGRPVEEVSWEDTEEFMAKVNEVHPDLHVRLPWEAEWEYACRAGSKAMFHFGDKAELSLDVVNYRGTWEYAEKEWHKDATQETADVKNYPCNDWGLFEMHGNVWEWCEDIWVENLGNDILTDPWKKTTAKPEAGAFRVVRGGSWDGGGGDVRSAFRDGDGPGLRDVSIGFRLALGHSEQ